MPEWRDLFLSHLQAKWLGLGAGGLKPAWAWVSELNGRAKEILSIERLRAEPPQNIYNSLKNLSFPQCPMRIAHLARVNEAPRIVAALVKLLESPGNFEEKMAAAKFPQAGVVTLTELLGAVKPQRFCIRNTALTRAAAKVVPFYSPRALNELPYEEYLDTMRELTFILEAALRPLGMEEWAKQHRFLALYASLVEPE